MPIVPFFTECMERTSFRIPNIRLINMFAEKTAAPTSFALMSRPALKRRFRLAASPIRGIFQTAGAFRSGVFIVAGNQFYNRGNQITGQTGSVTSVNNDFQSVRWACSATQLVLISGGKAYCYSGVAGVLGLRLITDPDLPLVSDVTYLDGRFYYNQAGSDLIWFSDLGDATSIDGLAFQEAESSPDKVVGACVLGTEIYMFGVDGTEVFAQSGNADAPLLRIDGRSFDKGCSAQASIINHDNTIYFIGSDRLIYRVGSVPERISTSGIEELLRKSAETLITVNGQKVPALTQAVAFSALYDGHAWYVVNIPGYGSFAYDSQTQKWAEWRSWGEDRFRVSYGITTNVSNSGETWLGDFSSNHGDDYSGWMYRLDSEVYKDGPDPIERLAMGGIPVESGHPANRQGVMLQCVRGVGNQKDENPLVEMRYSDDQAQEWSPWRSASLGQEGAYLTKAIWRRLGMMRSPGRAFQVRSSAASIVAFEALSIEETRP